MKIRIRVRKHKAIRAIPGASADTTSVGTPDVSNQFMEGY